MTDFDRKFAIAGFQVAKASKKPKKPERKCWWVTDECFEALYQIRMEAFDKAVAEFKAGLVINGS